MLTIKTKGIDERVKHESDNLLLKREHGNATSARRNDGYSLASKITPKVLVYQGSQVITGAPKTTENHKEAPNDNTYDPTDSTSYQRQPRIKMGSDGAREGFHTELKPTPQKTAELFSYLGTGVVRYAKGTGAHESERTEFLRSPPTPQQGGEIFERALARATLRAGDPLDPETKEHMLYWLLTPEGNVWRRVLETTAPVRTDNYSLTSIN